MIQCKESEENKEVREDVEEDFDYMNEEPLEVEKNSYEDEEPDY